LQIAKRNEAPSSSSLYMELSYDAKLDEELSTFLVLRKVR